MNYYHKRWVSVTVELALGAVLTLLVPVMRKLFRKMNTSLDVEENGNMQDIILSED